MANAKRDENNRPTLLAILNTDGETKVNVEVDAMHALAVNMNGADMDNGPDGRALRDENFVTTLIGVSSADGVTPVAVYADSNGKLLISNV